ncbi:unnamed protein product [Haemonchus placei]|uniref:Recep_L_domain domain-containing protein n=1 Tax=Haemonchus placei TaxID=6290 RepID=A0A0N4W5X7_HAEPC|nr:unnamed protein product [Haemonchus placei]
MPIEDLWASRCDTVTGEITINSATNLTESQLEKLFQNITTINGRVLVERTNLKRLTFLKNVVNLNTYYSAYVLEIIDNPFLSQVNLDKLTSADGMVTVRGNPLLNASRLCTQLEKIVGEHWRISGNKVDCGGFQLDFPLTFDSILNVPPNLTFIHGDVIFRETAIPPDRLAVLSSVKKISGCLAVLKTNFETLSFLGNLEEINCGDKRQAAISIFENDYLSSLGMPKLTKIRTSAPIEAQNNRIFEITFDEIEALVTTGVPPIQFNGFFPTENLPADICIFNSLTDDLTALNENCTGLVGLLYYEERSFSDMEVQILKRVRRIYGNIDLVNMDIEDLSMFSALEQVISLNKTRAIQLSSMSSLKSISLPKLKLVYAPTTSKFAVDNCPNIILTPSECEAFNKASHDAFSIDNEFCSH